ncbi:MgtC/SapB family protein [Salipiger aestuarii]|uniref:Protein MgtC n=1 Tax=Salipiger aestuarii TaxID=568098 RepID=A0A327YGN5_9RHOB|nr:MgtC/SapB family protein [Salipiger aestuarii]EIE51519.1 Mg(2+) transport ATPase [Citreicella sp. 357]KAA8612260.1 magnesium ABC transporter ATPase [Salipiger aestuarii]KAB2541387.1 magnesium ABC transporter ATPase [Salipiger aestuarii]RAK20043.1 putative Mg2+ transporter-C (MgtC) family protein [Salipiger aestuarii]
MAEWFDNFNFGITQTDWFLRLAFALIAGAVLGFDRELRRRRVGIRTYMMVAFGSAILTVTAVEMSRNMDGFGLSADPTRVLQGVVGGLGFLGAGAIIQGDDKVGGMATAASLWVAGALGLAAGAGFGLFAVLCAILAALLLAASRFMEHRGADDRPDAD